MQGGIPTLFQALNFVDYKKSQEFVLHCTLSDPIVVTDENDRILRCNHAVVDRLTTTFTKKAETLGTALRLLK